MLREETINRIEEIAARYPFRRSALLPALHIAQRELNGYVNMQALAQIAEIVGVPLSEAYGVQTYYSMFNPRQIGKYHLQVDTNITALLAGAEEIVSHLEKTLGIAVGQTTKDGLFTLSTVEDLASCGTCPVVQVNDKYFENMTIEKVDVLIDSLKMEK